MGASPRLPVTKCLQSAFGYPGVLDSAKRIDLQVNATCAGATTDVVAKTQLSALNPETRLVTLTVGGNDLGFAGLAGPCLAGTLKPAECLAAIDDAVAVGRLSKLGSALTDLFAHQVAVKAPDARIVVTGYPFLFDPQLPTITAPARKSSTDLGRRRHSSTTQSNKLSPRRVMPMSRSFTLT